MYRYIYILCLLWFSYWFLYPLFGGFGPKSLIPWSFNRTMFQNHRINSQIFICLLYFKLIFQIFMILRSYHYFSRSQLFEIAIKCACNSIFVSRALVNWDVVIWQRRGWTCSEKMEAARMHNPSFYKVSAKSLSDQLLFKYCPIKIRTYLLRFKGLFVRVFVEPPLAGHRLESTRSRNRWFLGCYFGLMKICTKNKTYLPDQPAQRGPLRQFDHHSHNLNERKPILI